MTIPHKYCHVFPDHLILHRIIMIPGPVWRQISVKITPTASIMRPTAFIMRSIQFVMTKTASIMTKTASIMTKTASIMTKTASSL